MEYMLERYDGDDLIKVPVFVLYAVKWHEADSSVGDNFPWPEVEFITVIDNKSKAVQITSSEYISIEDRILELERIQ